MLAYLAILEAVPALGCHHPGNFYNLDGAPHAMCNLCTEA